MARTRYTKEQKAEALALCDEIGVQEASEKTGITKNTLYMWRSKGSQTTPANQESPKPQPETEDSELIRLRVENDALRKQTASLKAALRAFTE